MGSCEKEMRVCKCLTPWEGSINEIPFPRSWVFTDWESLKQDPHLTKAETSEALEFTARGDGVLGGHGKTLGTPTLRHGETREMA